MRNHTRPLDHHRKSHYDTIRIGPEGKFNWVLQLNHNHTVKLFYSHKGEVQHVAFSQLTQPIPKPISDRSVQPNDTQGDARSGQPDGTHFVFVIKGETSRSHEINEKYFHERLCESDQGNLMMCLKTRVLSKLTIDQGNLMSVTAQVYTK